MAYKNAFFIWDFICMHNCLLQKPVHRDNHNHHQNRCIDRMDIIYLKNHRPPIVHLHIHHCQVLLRYRKGCMKNFFNGFCYIFLLIQYLMFGSP